MHLFHGYHHPIGFALPYCMFTFVASMACITLLSDLGLQDATVGSIRGILMQELPGIPVIDISHDVIPYHLQQAAYLLNTSYASFPEGSFHVVLCDVFYKANARMVLCRKDNHYFIAPDNGVLSLALGGTYEGAWELLPTDNVNGLRKLASEITATVKRIGSINTIEALALQACEMNDPLLHWAPKLTGNSVECHIIHIDRFENIVLNITHDQFTEFRNGRNFRIEFIMDAVSEISERYSDVRNGELLARFNSSGYLEIAINRDKAASLLGLKLSKEHHLIYRAVKIVFQ